MLLLYILFHSRRTLLNRSGKDENLYKRVLETLLFVFFLPSSLAAVVVIFTIASFGSLEEYFRNFRAIRKFESLMKRIFNMIISDFQLVYTLLLTHYDELYLYLKRKGSIGGEKREKLL